MLHIEMEAAESVMQKVRDNQREDPELSQLMDYLKHNILSADAALAKKDAQKGYYVADGILYYEDSSRQKLVVPALKTAVVGKPC